MTSPPKPWERAGINHQSSVSNFNNQMSSGPTGVVSGIGGQPSAGPATTISNAPPPVPTRPSQQRSGIGTGYGGLYSGGYGSYGSAYSPYGSLGGIGGGYGMYGSGMYGGYGSSYGGYGGYGMNRYGPQEYTQNGFVRQAEESSRQAFQSIESVVQAFGSVTMMLESTFYAVYNSFRAVIGVADNFTRLKAHFASIFSAFAALRALKWLYRKLLVLLRLREAGIDEDLWNSAAAATLSGAEALPGKPKSNWPVWFFFIVVIAGPYLIWRLLSSLTGDSGGRKWADGTAEHFEAEATFDFEGEQDDELSFRRGQRIRVAPKELQPRMRGWLLASVDGKKTGIVPANYVKVLGRQRGQRLSKQQEQIRNQTGTSAAEPQPQPSNSSMSLVEMESMYNNSSREAQNLDEVFSNPQEENFIQGQQNSSSMIENKEASEILTDAKVNEEWPK